MLFNSISQNKKQNPPARNEIVSRQIAPPCAKNQGAHTHRVACGTAHARRLSPIATGLAIMKRLTMAFEIDREKKWNKN